MNNPCHASRRAFSALSLFAFLVLPAVPAAAAPPAAPPSLDCALTLTPAGTWIRQFSAVPSPPPPPLADRLTRWDPVRLRPDTDASAPASLLWQTRHLAFSLHYDLDLHPAPATETDGGQPSFRAALSATLHLTNAFPIALRPREMVLAQLQPLRTARPDRLPAIVDESVPLSAPWRHRPPPPPVPWLPLEVPAPPEIPASAAIAHELFRFADLPARLVYEFDGRSAPWPTPADGLPARLLVELELPPAISNQIPLLPAAARVRLDLPPASPAILPATTPGAFPDAPVVRFAIDADAPGLPPPVHVTRLRPVASPLPDAPPIQTHTLTLANPANRPRRVRLVEPVDLARRWRLDSASVPAERLRPGLYAFTLDLPPAATTNLTLTLRHP